MLAMRIKGESVDEIAGFLDAAEASFEQLVVPVGAQHGGHAAGYAPIVIPSYNGSRNMANLTPLLVLLLARQGVPVLVHGVTRDHGRVTTAEILQAMGYPCSRSVAEAEAHLARREPIFMPIEVLAPRMARLLTMRSRLGVRNSTHTLVKIIQPFAQPALRLTSYTHPEYLEMLASYFASAAPQQRGDAFLMRGTEGETVANARRGQQIEWFHQGQRTVLVQKQEPVDILPALPAESDAHTTARWIEAALKGEQPIPQPIAEQVEQCLHVSKQLHSRQSDHGALR
jgi:anthranilate phosphoribosyltransferase